MGKSINFEEYNHHTNKWYEEYAFPCTKGQVGIHLRDITECKLAEEALKKAKIHARFNEKRMDFKSKF